MSVKPIRTVVDNADLIFASNFDPGGIKNQSTNSSVTKNGKENTHILFLTILQYFNKFVIFLTFTPFVKPAKFW